MVASLGWVPFHIGAMCVFTTHMCLNWVKVVGAPALGHSEEISKQGKTHRQRDDRRRGVDLRVFPHLHSHVAHVHRSKLDETVNLRVNTSTREPGSPDLTDIGLGSSSRSGKSFTESERSLAIGW